MHTEPADPPVATIERQPPPPVESGEGLAPARAAVAACGPAVRPVSMPLLDRIASAVVTAVPPIMLAIGMWFGWSGNLLDWKDLLVLGVSYVVIGTGVTVGFHRLLTHRSFKTSRLLRAAFAALGSAAAEGPVIDWVATHRSTISSPTWTAIRTAHTSATAPAGAAPSGGSCMRTSAGCSPTWRSRTSTATPRICWRTR